MSKNIITIPRGEALFQIIFFINIVFLKTIKRQFIKKSFKNIIGTGKYYLKTIAYFILFQHSKEIKLFIVPIKMTT